MQTLINSNYQVISTHNFAQVRQNFKNKQNALFAVRSFQPGDVIAEFYAGTISAEPTYLTVQVGIRKHITLQPEFLQYINHSCDPNVFFDTSTTAAPVRIMQLTDDLTLPDTGTFKYRVINLVPDTSVKADIWLVNGAADSVQLASANTFIGSTAEASAVQTFDTTTYRRTPYTIKFKKTGTEEIYAAVATYPFAAQGVYSIMFSGLPGGAGNTGFKLTVLHHHIP